MLDFWNSTERHVWVAIMYYSPNCPDGGNFSKAGWWHLAPYGQKTLFNGNLSDLNRYYCFYAHDEVDKVWAGQYVRPVPPTAFDWCEFVTNSQSRNVGFRLLDIGDSDNSTVMLWQLPPLHPI
jgi:uncharacterized membrane protein